MIMSHCRFCLYSIFYIVMIYCKDFDKSLSEWLEMRNRKFISARYFLIVCFDDIDNNIIFVTITYKLKDMKQPKIIGIAGKAHSGKDVVAGIIT